MQQNAVMEIHMWKHYKPHSTLQSLIRVPQPQGGVKIMLYVIIVIANYVLALSVSIATQILELLPIVLQKKCVPHGFWWVFLQSTGTLI